MATTFEHRRYPALTLQDENGIWAQFAEEKRTFGEHVVRVGVLRTDDAALVKRLRAAPDPDLIEVGQAEPTEVADATPEADAETEPATEPETPAPTPRATRRR